MFILESRLKSLEILASRDILKIQTKKFPPALISVCTSIHAELILCPFQKSTKVQNTKANSFWKVCTELIPGCVTMHFCKEQRSFLTGDISSTGFKPNPASRKGSLGCALSYKGRLHRSHQRLGVIPLKQATKTVPMKVPQPQTSELCSVCVACSQFAGSRFIFTCTVRCSLKHFPSPCPEEINPWHTF